MNEDEIKLLYDLHKKIVDAIGDCTIKTSSKIEVLLLTITHTFKFYGYKKEEIKEEINELIDEIYEEL